MNDDAARDFSPIEAFLLSRGYRKHDVPQGRLSNESCLYQKRARADDPVTDAGELYFNFKRYDPCAYDSRYRLEGSCQITRDGLTMNVDVFGFLTADITTLLDGIEAEWFAIADRQARPGNLQCSCGSYDVRVMNVTGGCCKADEFTEAWQKIGCMDCGQDLGIACDGNGRKLLAHRPFEAEVPR